MDSPENKSGNRNPVNVSVIKEECVESQTCDNDSLPKDMMKSHEITNGSSSEKVDSGINEAVKCEQHSGVSECTDVVMAEKIENGSGESREQMDKGGDSPDYVDGPPSNKSELVVLDEVDESLDGKEDNDVATSSKEVGVDAKTSGVEGDKNQKKNADDPYAYVKREDFTSEKYKIEIRGLPRFYGYGELKKFLNDRLKLSSHKMKPTRNKSPGVFVCFKNEEDRQAALKTLNRLPWKGKMLTAMTAKPAPDPLVKKRKLENEAALNQPEKKPRISDDEKLRNSTTPYWNLSYDEQLKKKYEYVMKIMCRLADQIMSVNPMLVPWIKRQKAKYNGMACDLLDIRKSPICDGYRNKCEFTIGIKQDTKQRMVGFRLGSYVQGHVGVGPIDSLKHIPQRMKDTVKVFEKFIKDSDREPFNPETHTGHWRQLTLRLTTLDELMAVVLVNSKGASMEELTRSKEEVRAFFENGEGKNLNVNSLYFQAFGKREAGKEPPKMEHLLGSKYITESILGLKFRISPEAFFQVNTPGASVLYSTVGEMIDLNPSTTVVDVCCGTGTIGLSLAKNCGQVLGLEVVAPAIEDAKVNAIENNITNVEFFTGRAEEILTSVLSRAKGKSVHAIVDPPRSGLQQKAIVSLRGAEVIDKIIYVSCDPNAALKNFVDLARITSKAYRGYPLVPITAIPVDMFPHTGYCEVVLLFHRINPINLPKTFPAKDDDISILSATLSKSPQKPLQPPDSEKKEGGGENENGATGNGENGSGATENDAGETMATETNNDSKNSQSGKDQKESIVSTEQHASNRQKSRRRRAGRNQRILSRNLLGVEPNKVNVTPFMPGQRQTLPDKVSALEVGNGSQARKPPSTIDRPEPKKKIPTNGKIEKFGPMSPFRRDKLGNKDPFIHSIKPDSKFMMKERNPNPRVGDSGYKRKWRKDDELPLRVDSILHKEEKDVRPLPPVQRGGMGLEDIRENYLRRAPRKDQESQRRQMRSRSPPSYTSRDGIGRRSGMGSDENVWERLEQGVRNWVEQRERTSESPPRKLLRGGNQPSRLEVTGHEGGRYSPMRPGFREDWVLHPNSRPLEHESRVNGKDIHDREEDVRFGRIMPERTLICEPNEGWGKRRQRESLSPVRRYEDGERWGPGNSDVKCENDEGFSFRRRKYNDEVECSIPNISDLEERHSRRSCERFSRRSPEILKRRYNDSYDRRFCERYERRSLERYESSSERFDRRSSERDRSPCERCERRSNERLCRPPQQDFVNDIYHESRQESFRPADNFIGTRPNKLSQERETIVHKYPEQMEPVLHHSERYNEPETRHLINFRENRNNESGNEREYMNVGQPESSPRKMVGIIGSVELHRKKNEVYVYRTPNDASFPSPLNVEGRIPVSHPSAENRASHYESNVLRRNYDGEEPGIQNDHNLISRRVEVIRRPFMVDDKYGMLLDTSGKSLGTAEVLVVTAKNQMYDGDQRSQFNPNDGVSSTRILERREMGVMHKPWKANGSPPPAYLKPSSPANKFDNHSEIHSGPPGNWAFEKGLKEIPKPWGEMERSNQIREQPGIPDANISQFTFSRHDIDERRQNTPQSKHPGATPMVRHSIEKPFAYSTPQAGGYGPKAYCPEPNSQFPMNVTSHVAFPNKIPEHSQPSQNAPFRFVSSLNTRVPVPTHQLNSLPIRPALFNQSSSNFMGSGMQGTQQMLPMVPKQPLPTVQSSIVDISYRQKMPSVPDSKVSSWNFKGISPWSENNQQMVLQQKHW